MATDIVFLQEIETVRNSLQQFDRELLAIYLAIKHFRHFFEGQQFHILTDHKPLIFSLFCNPHRYSARQTRHLDLILQLTSDIRHVSGSNNPVADALSHIDIQAVHHVPSMIDFAAMATAQSTDRELQNLKT